MIIGGGEAGRSLITEIQNSKYLDQKVVCIIDDDPYKIGRYIKESRLSVIGTVSRKASRNTMSSRSS